jgi:hypothetical protein
VVAIVAIGRSICRDDRRRRGLLHWDRSFDHAFATPAVPAISRVAGEPVTVG